MEWKHAIKDPPKKSGEYLCYVLYTAIRGNFSSNLRSLHYDIEQSWVCDSMIVAYWTDMPELPKEIVL